ncbi:MAG: hypothetical protein CO149_05285, partial [Nitrospirae bacterium CG_4_9_14_3_um_filter_51_5]
MYLEDQYNGKAIRQKVKGCSPLVFSGKFLIQHWGLATGLETMIHISTFASSRMKSQSYPIDAVIPRLQQTL